jgi:DNA-binding NarL/FixJ family response regulator
VVIADDHPAMRNAIESVLSSSFDVVAAVANGRQAVEAVHRLDPDVVVLDISMPVLDGFGAARELTGGGTRAKLLFLSVHDSDKNVADAVQVGVHGYVAKPRLATDLEDAITHVLRGRLRLPTSSSVLGLTDARARHAVHISEHDESGLQDLHEFAGRALRRGDSFMAIARRALLDSVASHLAGDGFDLASLGTRGRYQTLDVEEYLPHIMRGDDLDEAALVGFIRALEGAHAASTKDTSNNLVVFGEGAPLLMQQGNVRAALTLERMWHGHSGGFQTLCSYRRAGLEACEQPELDELYSLHPAVSAA